MSWASDKRTRTRQGKFALLWLGLTLLAIYWFIDQSWGMTNADLDWLDRRLRIVQSIVVVSGVSFSVVFLALMGFGAFLSRRR